MADRIDWNKRLVPGTRGIVVEGKTDQLILNGLLETFIRSGVILGSSQRYRPIVEQAGKFEHVLRELRDRADLWGLVDRDWRSDMEVADLRRQYPNLLFLPRVMIENFAVNPAEIVGLLPPPLRSGFDLNQFETLISADLSQWVQHGAMSKMLWDSGAHRFCRDETGYPMRLIDQPVANEADIERYLSEWRGHFEPETVMPRYRQQLQDFNGLSASEQIRRCIDGKMFFKQVVVDALNKTLHQKYNSDRWIEELFTTPESIAPDLLPILEQLVI